MFEYIGDRNVHSAWYHPNTCHEPCLYYKNGFTPQYDWFDDYRDTQTEPRTNLWTKSGTWIQGTGLKTYYNYYGAYQATASGKFFYTNEVGASLTFDSYRTVGELFGMINITMDDISGVININGRNISGVDMSYNNYYYMYGYYQSTMDIYVAVNDSISQVYWTRPWGYNWWNLSYGYLHTTSEGYNASSTVDADNLVITVVNPGTGYIRVNGCYNLNPAIPGKFKHDKTYVDNYDSNRCQEIPQIYCNACDNNRLSDNISINISNIPAAIPAEDYYSYWQRVLLDDPRVAFYGNTSYYGNCHVMACLGGTYRFVTNYYKNAQQAWIEDGCCLPYPYIEFDGIIRSGWGWSTGFATFSYYGGKEYWRTYSLGACKYASGDTASVTQNSPTSISITFWLEAATGVDASSSSYDWTLAPQIVMKPVCVTDGHIGRPHFLSATDDNIIEVTYGGGGDSGLKTDGFSVTIDFPDPVIQPRTGPVVFGGQSYTVPTIYNGSRCDIWSSAGYYVRPFLYVTGCYDALLGCPSPTVDNYMRHTQQTHTYTIYTTDGITLQASTGWISDPHFIVGYCDIGHLFVVANNCNLWEGFYYGDVPPSEYDFIVTKVEAWSAWNVRNHTDMRLWDCDKFNGTFVLPKTETCLYEDSMDLSDSTIKFGRANPLAPYSTYGTMHYSCTANSWARFRVGFYYYPGSYYGGWSNYYNPYYYYYGGYGYYSYYWLYWQNGNYGYFFPPINEIVDDLLFFNQAARIQCDIYKDANLYGYNTTTGANYYASGVYPEYYFTYYRDVATCRGFMDYNNPGTLPTLTVNDSTNEVTISPFIYSAAGPGGSVLVSKPAGLTATYKPITTIIDAGRIGSNCGYVNDDYKTNGCSGVYTIFFSISTSGTIDFNTGGTAVDSLYGYNGIPFNYFGSYYWFMGGYFAGNTIGALSFILQPGETDYDTRVQDYMCYRMNDPQRQMLSWPNYKNLDVNTIFFGSGVGNGMLLDSNMYLWLGAKYTISDTIINTSTWVDNTYYFYTKAGEIKWYTSQCPKSSGFYLGYQTYTHTFSRPITYGRRSFIYPYTDPTKSTFFNSPTVASAIYDVSSHILTISGIGDDFFDFYATGTPPLAPTYQRYKLYTYSAYSPANNTYIHYYINKNGVFSINTTDTINPSWTPTEGIIIGTVITNGLGLHTFNDRRTEPTDTRHGLYLFNFCPEDTITSSIGTDPMTYQFQYRDPTPNIPWRSEVWFNGSPSYKTGTQTVSYYPIETGFFNMYYNSGGTLVVNHNPVNDRDGLTLCTFEVRKNMSITDTGYYYGSIFGASSSPYFGYYYYGWYGFWYTYGWYKNPEDVCGALNCNNLVDFPLKPLQFRNWCNTAPSGYIPNWDDSDRMCDMGESECKISSI